MAEEETSSAEEGLESWLAPQVESMTASWSSAIARFYPEIHAYWSDPVVNVESLDSAYLEAFCEVPWHELLPRPGARVLDVGCGTGWLAARLSRLAHVALIEAVDIDRAGLVRMLPRVVDRVGGEAAKIRPIVGLFEPVQRPSAHYDLVTASSSIHHAPNLFTALRELRRVVADDGAVLLLNEAPRTFEEYLDDVLHRVHLIVDQTLGQVSSEHPLPLSANGLCSDAFLGDQTYSYHHYHAALVAAGLTYRVHKTGRTLAGRRLVHFLCAPAPRGAEPLALSQVEGLGPADVTELSPEIRRAVREVLRAAWERIVDPPVEPVEPVAPSEPSEPGPVEPGEPGPVEDATAGPESANAGG